MIHNITTGNQYQHVYKPRHFDSWGAALITPPSHWVSKKVGDQSGHTNAFLVDCEQLRHPFCTEHFHYRIVRNNIMDFIDHFWCSGLIWTTWIWYGLGPSIYYVDSLAGGGGGGGGGGWKVVKNCPRGIWMAPFCARTTTTKFGKSLLNDSIQRSRVRIITRGSISPGTN